jgi:hypothetical protein
MRSLVAILSILLLGLSNLHAADKTDLKTVIENHGKGSFNCAYQGETAGKTCSVKVKVELVKHPEFVKFYGKAAKVDVLTIGWPDGDISKYAWSDSGEMINLKAKDAWGYRLAGDEVVQDWSRGFVIISSKTGSEYIRLW